MKRRIMFTLFAASSLALAGGAMAQSGEAGASAGASQATKATTPVAQATAESQTNAAANAKAAKLEKIRERGMKASAAEREKAEARLDAVAQKVNEAAKADEGQSIAKRLAADLKLESSALIDEKSALDASWGDLMIAHTLAANSKAGVTASDLVQLKHRGTGWGQIAAGLGLHLDGAVNAVGAEAKVAQGMTKADGKVAVIHGDGARASAGGNAGLATGVKTERVDAGAGASLGAGVKVGH